VKRTNRLVLVVGILLAVVAFVGVFFVLNQKGGNTGPQAIPQANVVVATKDIKLGEAIQDNQVEQKQIPLSDKRPEYFAQTGDVIGQVSRTDIAKGAYLTAEMFSATGTASVSKDLPSGTVAIAVRVDALTGVGTLILAGDRVDAVITMTMTPVTVTPVESAPPQVTKQDALATDSTKLILQNLEVRAILGASAGTVATTGTGAPPDLTTAQQVVILAVTPQQAEVIEYLQQQAKTAGSSAPNNNITLVLRSPKDKDAPNVETTGVILQTLIKDYGVLPPQILEASLPPTK
jgi:Flp pilus assembly protein CpaB